MGALQREGSSLDELAGAMRAVGSQLLVRADRVPQTVTADGTVGAYLRACCRELPPAAGTSVAPAVLARASWPMPGAFHHLYLLALGELVNLCEAAEKGCGVRPIRLVA